MLARVLGKLGPERRLATFLAVANVVLAATAFAEPVLFGRIIDGLYAYESGARKVRPFAVFGMMGAWAGFGLFTIAASVYVALHADRLAHRRRLAVIEHQDRVFGAATVAAA